MNDIEMLNEELKKEFNDNKSYFSLERYVMSELLSPIEDFYNAINIIRTTAQNCGFKVKVLYGGSVNAGNYKDILKSNTDGLLLGGVSNKINEFLKIVKGE